MTIAIGPKLTAATGAWHAVAANQQLGLEAAGVFVAPANGWITAIGVWARRVSGSPSVYLAAYTAQPNGAPLDRLGRTNLIAVSTATNGAAIEAAVAATDPDLSPSATTIRVVAGQVVPWAVRVEGGAVEFAVVPGAADHHLRTVASGYPTDPFAATAEVAALPLIAAWFLFDEDRAPSAPSALTPAAGATSNATVPTFSGAFVDADAGAPWRDRIREYRIEVRDPATQAELWGGPAATFTASAAERQAARFSRPSGLTLSPGQTVEWHAAVADDLLAYSDWSAWQTYTVNGAGQVDTATDGSPTGKVDTDPAAIAWTARWYHPQGYAADRVQVHVLQGGAVVKTGTEVVKAVASSASPGTLFTIASGEDGIGRLEQGVAYAYQVRARAATGGIWSLWSAERAFSTNAPPTVPTNLQPPGGSASSVFPLLEWESEDPDPDDVEGTDVVWDVRIFSAGDALLGTYVATAYDPDRGVASLQTSGTHLSAGFGTYQFDVRGRDVSAGALGTSEWSRRQSFLYQSGPAVTVTRPAADGAVVATAALAVQWTTVGQVRYRVTLYRADERSPFYDSGERTSAAGEHQIAAGVYRNGGSYDLVVEAWNGAGQKGTSLRRRFAASFPPPRALDRADFSPYRYPGDPVATAVVGTWDHTDRPPGNFEAYVVRRRRSGEDRDRAVRLRTIRAAGQTRYVDPHAPFGVPLVYEVSQLVREGQEVVESDAVEATVELAVDAPWVVLASVVDPASRRAVLHWEMAGQPAEHALALDIAAETVQTWGGGAPTQIRAPGPAPERRDCSGAWFLDDAFGSARQHVERVRGAGAARELVSYRAGGDRFFGVITAFEARIDRRGIYEVRVLTVEERDYREKEA